MTSEDKRDGGECDLTMRNGSTGGELIPSPVVVVSVLVAAH